MTIATFIARYMSPSSEFNITRRAVTSTLASDDREGGGLDVLHRKVYGTRRIAAGAAA